MMWNLPIPDDGPRAPAPEFPASAVPGRLLACALDELDYGVVLINAEAEILHLNRRAAQLLDADHPLQRVGHGLRASDPRDLATWQAALQAAAVRGLRKLLSLGDGDHRQLAALVPVQAGTALLLMGRSTVCEDLSLQCFARNHALTGAETRVLAALGRGEAPASIAREQGVKLSTVRTQIGAIREKTGTESITALIRMVASLPPIVGVLRP